MTEHVTSPHPPVPEAGVSPALLILVGLVMGGVGVVVLLKVESDDVTFDVVGWALAGLGGVCVFCGCVAFGVVLGLRRDRDTRRG